MSSIDARSRLAFFAVMVVMAHAGCGDRRVARSAPLQPAPAIEQVTSPPPALAAPALAAAEACPALDDPDGWFDLGRAAPAPDGTRARAAGSGGGLVTHPSLGGAAVTLDAQGVPFVAYARDQGVHVMRLERAGWQPVGTLDPDLGVRLVGAAGSRGARLRDGFGMSTPAIAADGQGGLLVAWIDQAPPWSGRVRMARWRNGAWLDASPRTGPQLGCARWDVEFGAMSEMPAIHVSERGDVWVACMQPLADARTMPRFMPSGGPMARPSLEVRHWNGRGWQRLPARVLGQAGFMTEVGGRHTIALAGHEDTVVALHAEHDGKDWRRQALRWDPARGAWRASPVSAPANATLLGVTTGARALWLGGDTIAVHDMITGDSVARVPAPAALQGYPGSGSMVYPAGVAMSRSGSLALLTMALLPVEFVPRSLRVHVWTGSTWADETATRWHGGVSKTSGSARAPAIAVDHCGRPVVAWLQAHAQGSDVYFRRFSGTEWQELGGSAGGGGVSRSGQAREPAVAIDGAGRPVVMWWEQDLDAGRLRAVPHVRRFVDGRWQDVGSAPVLHGVQPLAADTSLWAEGEDGLVAATPDIQRGDIVVLRWNGSAWTVERLDGGGAGQLTWRWPQRGPDGRIRAIVLDPAGSTVQVGVWQRSFELERSVARATPAPVQGAVARIDAHGRVWLAWAPARTWPASVHVDAERDQRMVTLDGTASNSDAHAMEPALAVGARTCVAWVELDQADMQMFVRCKKSEP